MNNYRIPKKDNNIETAITNTINLIVLIFFFLNNQYKRNTIPKGRILGNIESNIPCIETLAITKLSGNTKDT